MRKNISTERFHYFLTDPCSQWYPSEFNGPDGAHYFCAEQFMMRGKALLFGDEASAQKIMLALDPADMKAIGRGIAGYDDAVWTQNRDRIVMDGNLLKFSQNASLWKFLDGLGSRELVEAAHYDKIWGVGLNAEDCVAIEELHPLHPQAHWDGLNCLGKALMATQSMLRAHPELAPDKQAPEISMSDASGQREILLAPEQCAKILGLDLQGLRSRLSSHAPGRVAIAFDPFVKSKEGMVGERDAMLAQVELALLQKPRHKLPA